MGKHSKKGEAGARGGHPRRAVVKAAEVLEHQQREGPGLPATPSTVARALTWRLLKLVQDPEDKAAVKEAANTPFDPSDAHMLWHVHRIVAHQAYERGDLTAEEFLKQLHILHDSGRKLGEFESRRTVGPSVHGASVTINLTLGDDAYSDDGPGDILEVG